MGYGCRCQGFHKACLLLMEGLDGELSARRMGKGNQRTKAEKDIIRSATTCQYSGTLGTEKKSNTRLVK